MTTSPNSNGSPEERGAQTVLDLLEQLHLLGELSRLQSQRLDILSRRLHGMEQNINAQLDLWWQEFRAVYPAVPYRRPQLSQAKKEEADKLPAAPAAPKAAVSKLDL